jgi:Gpi18-like mannosyltransferase
MTTQSTRTTVQAGLAWLQSPNSRWLTVPVAVFLFTRLLVIMIAVLADTTLPATFDDSVYDPADTWKYQGFESLWLRWDTQWYVEIVENGYWFRPGNLSPVSWFPVYPMLMRFLTPLVGNPLWAGLVISHVCFLLALIVLYRLVYEMTGRDSIARRSVVYIAIFPTALFFSAVYTESIFLLLSLLVAYYARKQRWVLASLAGAIGAATRVPGFLLAVMLGLEWLRVHGWAWRSLLRDWRSALVIALAPSGLIAYFGYLWFRFGDPLIFLDSTRANAQRMNGPIAAFQREVPRFFDGVLPYAYNFPFDVAVFFFVLVASVIIARRFGLGWGVYCFASIMLAAWSGSLRSMARYAVVLFPVFILLAHWGENRLTDRVYRSLSILGLSVYTVLYIKWFFAG